MVIDASLTANHYMPDPDDQCHHLPASEPLAYLSISSDGSTGPWQPAVDRAPQDAAARKQETRLSEQSSPI